MGGTWDTARAERGTVVCATPDVANGELPLKAMQAWRWLGCSEAGRNSGLVGTNWEKFGVIQAFATDLIGVQYN